MKKRYTLTYDWNQQVVVDIDHDKCTDALLHEINNFWSGAKERLSDAEGDVRKAVLTMLCTSVLRSTIQDNSAMYEFTVAGVEGWPKFDGSFGITLVSVDDFEFDEDEVTIKSEDLPEGESNG